MIKKGWIAKMIVKVADAFNEFNIHAVAIWPWIFVLPEYAGDEKLIRHERKHLDQWKRYLIIAFLPVYLYYHFKYGYWDNPLEVEARDAES